MPLPENAHCYYRHPEESWVWGKVCSFDGKKKQYTCTALTEGNSFASPERLPPGNWPPPVPLEPTAGIPDNDNNIFTVREDIVHSTEYEDTDDLLRLTILHDSTLLSCIKKRYFQDSIYTFIGAIVVAVNPFNYEIPWYKDENMEKYLQEAYPIQKNRPHSWACAHNTYHELRMDARDQTILVSGESGAGKTEASKIVLKYLSAISSRMSGEEEKTGGLDVRSKIMAASPFLEAFGNAKTGRNDNSSRFGKFMQIKFSDAGAIVGANITKYLLEKSRIITAGPKERIYHSFYLAVRGNGQPCGATTLTSDKDFVSLNSGGCVDNNEFNTTAEFKEVSDAMRQVGITDDEVSGIWTTLAAILHLVNVSFEKDGDGSKVASKTKQEIAKSAAAFGIDETQLASELTLTLIELRGEKHHRKLNVAKALDGRDAFVKRMYDQMFSWLVKRCNETLDVAGDFRWIGLLDIFGFEHFEENSFEQLCINTANEALQGNYNEHIFLKDMEECRQEGVDVTEVEFPDNAPCIDLVMSSKPPGLFSLLDSASLLSKGDPKEDEKWLQDIAGSFEKHKFFEKKRLARDSFIVRHFAGDVSYTVKGFVEKNADTLKEAWKDVVVSSNSPFVRGLVWETEKKKRTVAGFFKDQLKDLMQIITASNPHWIRCVKPHPAKKPMLFDGNQVAFQLTTSGVLATVSIRKAGYPVRLGFADFNKRYRVLFYNSSPPSGAKRCCETLLELYGFGRERAQLGSTRVFLKQDAYVRFEELKRECTRKVAVMVQQIARVRLAKLNVWRPALWLHHTRVIQTETRTFLDRSRELRRERANRRRRAELETLESLHRNGEEEEEERALLGMSEQRGRVACWVAKIMEETRAAALGLNWTEERAREGLAEVEETSRAHLRTKLTWAIDFKEVLEVELQEQTQRVRVAQDIHQQWGALLTIWIPMQLFELEMGRGATSERTARRALQDEEASYRRLLSSRQVEAQTSAARVVCESIETCERDDIVAEWRTSCSFLRREQLTAGSNALLSECVHLLRSDLSRRGADEVGTSDRDSVASTHTNTSSPLLGRQNREKTWWAGGSHPSSPTQGTPAVGWGTTLQKLPSDDRWHPQHSLSLSSQQSSPLHLAAAVPSLPISPVSYGSNGVSAFPGNVHPTFSPASFGSFGANVGLDHERRQGSLGNGSGLTASLFGTGLTGERGARQGSVGNGAVPSDGLGVSAWKGGGGSGVSAFPIGATPSSAPSSFGAPTGLTKTGLDLHGERGVRQGSVGNGNTPTSLFGNSFGSGLTGLSGERAARQGSVGNGNTGVLSSETGFGGSSSAWKGGGGGSVSPAFPIGAGEANGSGGVPIPQRTATPSTTRAKQWWEE